MCMCGGGGYKIVLSHLFLMASCLQAFLSDQAEALLEEAEELMALVPEPADA